MKEAIGSILMLFLIMSIDAKADCLRNQYGNVVCGKGQCEADQFGKIYCADIGGGAIRDQFAKVQCGVGYCAKDITGQVWCSKEQGGAAALDSNGKVKCLGGCEAGTASLCKEAQE